MTLGNELKHVSAEEIDNGSKVTTDDSHKDFGNQERVKKVHFEDDANNAMSKSRGRFS